MTERERTIIRLAGLLVHACGFAAFVIGLVVGVPGPMLLAGLLMFVVGGAWGWGMVLAAARRDADERVHRRARAEFAQRSGFTAAFDDEPEPAPSALPTIPPPPGGP